MIEVGDTLRFFYQEGNPNNRTVHVRAIVDDDYIVIRQWSRRRQRWIYTVEDRLYFEISQAHLVKVRGGRANG